MEPEAGHGSSCMCMSVRPKQPCLPQREVQNSVDISNNIFPSETLLFSNIFLHSRQIVELLGALSRAPQALVVGGCAPSIHPRPPGWLGLPKRSRASPPPTKRHPTSTTAAKTDSNAIAPRARPPTSTAARRLVSATAADPISKHFISIPTRDIPRPGSRPQTRHRSRPTAPATSSPPLSHHPAAGPPSSAHPWPRPTDRPTDPKRRQHQRRRRHLAAPTMDDYVSESDSDYTSYWRDWVPRPHPSQHLSV